MKILRIKDWENVFESYECRRLKKLNWVAVPTSWDGLGFARLRKHKDAAGIFGAWCLIVQIASKMPRRGLLVGADGVPLTAEDMGDMTGFPLEMFEQAIKVLSSEQIGWIEALEDGNFLSLPSAIDPPPPAQSAGTPAPLAETPAQSAGTPALHNSTRQDQETPYIPLLGGGLEPQEPKESKEEQAAKIYAVYPRHSKPDAAKRAILKALQSTPAAVLLEAVQAYKAATDKWPQDKRGFIPHPSTWFNAGSWKDDRETWGRNTSGASRAVESGRLKGEGEFLSGKDDSNAI